ncbi:hypothetical protein EWM62_00585 [Mucilaginibacter terrigena]|uniref:Uncharacterized protein n=1 Tax=Mucilaginibacter terrigena TaxID=2492395 RepID=A0A4Q5LR70_9SPHI|nr:hypothetical protein [Mucilaginibacter terrigena]RYU91972.1 hypothetical protein EWM62_00585 [Mucilaginibacter terrigena]
MSLTKPLHIRFTFKTLLVFQFFFFAMHELHELAHIVTGRLMCGAWGTRDFNVWRLCETCNVPYPEIATFAGPVLTFIMLWLGRYWLKHGAATSIRSFGLVMIFGNMPFGRLYMAAMGSGDEMWGLRSLFLNAGHSNLLLLRIINFVVVAAICLPPLVVAYKAIGNKRKILVFIALLIIPLMLDTIILLMLLNGLLATGFLNHVYLMGTPLLIQLWFINCIAIVIAGYRCLTTFAIEKT